MIGLIINMNISALDVRKTLELDLELLGNVVRRSEGFFGVHDDVDFDDEAGAGVVGADRVDLADEGGVCHS